MLIQKTQFFPSQKSVKDRAKGSTSHQMCQRASEQSRVKVPSHCSRFHSTNTPSYSLKLQEHFPHRISPTPLHPAPACTGTSPDTSFRNKRLSLRMSTFYPPQGSDGCERKIDQRSFVPSFLSFIPPWLHPILTEH